MADWTPWQVVTLVVGLAAVGLGFVTVAAWYILKVRQRELSDLGPDGRAARWLGVVLGRCGSELEAGAADELVAIFARSSEDQRRALVAAISGLFEAAPDGPENLPDASARVLALARHLGNAEAGADRPSAVGTGTNPDHAHSVSRIPEVVRTMTPP